MSITNTITRSVSDGSTTITNAEAVAAGVGHYLDETVPQSQTDLVIAFAFAIAKLKSFYMTCDKAIIVKTYNDVTLKETITLVAGQAVQWTLADGTSLFLPLPFASDVTSIKVTTGAVGNALLRIRAVVDPT